MKLKISMYSLDSCSHVMLASTVNYHNSVRDLMISILVSTTLYTGILSTIRPITLLQATLPIIPLYYNNY